MIVINIVVVMVAPDHDPMLEFVRAVQERDERDFRERVEELRRNTESITCERCGQEFWGYSTPGRAKMALSGHQRWCKRP